MLKEIDPVAYEQAVEDHSQKEDNQSTITIANRNRLDGMWNRLDQKLLDVDPLYEKPTLPFDPSTLPMHCNWLYDKIQHKERYLYE